MDAKKCDRCGAYYEKNRCTFARQDKNAATNIKVINESGYVVGVYDLCDDCMADFKRWLENGK